MPDSEAGAATIREATTEDVVGIVYVQATTWLSQYPNPEAGITEADLREIDWHGKLPQWQHMVKSHDYTVLVAASGDQIYGFLSASMSESYTRINYLYVLPQQQRAGLGTRLLNTWLELREDMDVWLEVVDYNREATRFYENHGFRPTGSRGAYRLPGGKTIPTIALWLSRAASERATPSGSEESEVSAPRLLNRAQLARELGVRESTIKWYSEQGLLPYHQSESKRRRYYDPNVAAARLEDIQHWQSQGLSLEQIRRRVS